MSIDVSFNGETVFPDATQERSKMKRCFALITLGWIAALLASCGQPSIRLTATSAPRPTVTLMADWHYVTGQGVAISLPDAFVGGDLSESTKQAIVKQAGTTNQSAVTMIEALEQVPHQQILLVAVDTKASQAGSLTALTITGETVSSALHPLTHLETYLRGFPKLPFTVRSKEEQSIGGYPAGRMIVEWGEKGARQVLYAIRVNTRMYVVGFSVPYTEYEKMLPVLDQSIQTFMLEP